MAIIEIDVSDDFVSICKNIISEEKTEKQWAEMERDDMFQLNSFEGGFDADENAFCFSYYDENKKEYWFQLTLEQVRSVVDGELTNIQMREAEQ